MLMLTFCFLFFSPRSHFNPDCPSPVNGGQLWRDSRSKSGSGGRARDSLRAAFETGLALFRALEFSAPLRQREEPGRTCARTVWFGQPRRSFDTRPLKISNKHLFDIIKSEVNLRPQWGSEHRLTIKFWTHLCTKLIDVWILNGKYKMAAIFIQITNIFSWIFKWVFKTRTIWHPSCFWPFKIRTCIQIPTVFVNSEHLNTGYPKSRFISIPDNLVSRIWMVKSHLLGWTTWSNHSNTGHRCLDFELLFKNQTENVQISQKLDLCVQD